MVRLVVSAHVVAADLIGVLPGGERSDSPGRRGRVGAGYEAAGTQWQQRPEAGRPSVPIAPSHLSE